MSGFLARHLYFGLGLAGLAAMTLLIGRDLADCPVKSPALHVGALSAATGLAAIGLGALLNLAPGIDLFGDGMIGLFLTLGGVLVALGLGFTHAVTILRGLAREVSGPSANAE